MPSGDTTNNAAGVIAISVNIASRRLFSATLRPFKARALLLFVVSGIVQYLIIPLKIVGSAAWERGAGRVWVESTSSGQDS